MSELIVVVFFFLYRFVSNFRRVSEQIVRKLFSLQKYLFLAGSFQFCLRCDLLSTHFNHFMLCYSGFSIFYGIHFIDLTLNIFYLLFWYVLVSSHPAFLCVDALALFGFLSLSNAAFFLSYLIF